MSTLNRSAAFTAPSGLVGALKTFADEAYVLVQTLLNPRKIIAEVEQMRALLVDANRIEATNPARAAVLRRQASRIGLR